MRPFFVALIILGAVLCGSCGSGSTGGGPNAGTDPQTSPAASKDYEQIRGVWRAVAIEAAAKPVPKDRVQKIDLQYIFDGDKVTIRRPDRPDQTSSFTVDATAGTKKMTINQTPPVRAIYSLGGPSGNTMQLCIMVDEDPNAGYPTVFGSKASPKIDLLTLERR